MKRAILFLPFLASCLTEMPDVDPNSFACESDVLSERTGELPCPETHYCFEKSCAERLNCNIEGASRPGCEENVSRCEPVFGEETSAVRCEGGVHTSTSAPAGSECSCPDGTYCVVFTTGLAVDDYPLYLLPAGSILPTNELGITGEHESWRMCVRACSEEINCSANHTCRAAAVITDRMLEDPNTRNTIGICYPNLLVHTASTAPQPDPLACRQQSECALSGRGRYCQYRVDRVADHPRVPAKEAWGERNALIAGCTDEVAGLVPDGDGCTENRGQLCKSGICYDGRCATPCDPLDPLGVACDDFCKDTLVEREFQDGKVLYERVYICDRL